MPMITGLGYTRKDKIFAEFYIDGSFYTFKEKHTSKKGYYDVGIYRDGTQAFKIGMSREQINRIKENKGIAGINFQSEQGFIDWINANYLDREFNEKAFRQHFETWYLDRFLFLQEGNNTDVEYISYLMSLLPSDVLESFYRNNRKDLQRTFKYLDIGSTTESSELSKD